MTHLPPPTSHLPPSISHSSSSTTHTNHHNHYPLLNIRYSLFPPLLIPLLTREILPSRFLSHFILFYPVSYRVVEPNHRHIYLSSLPKPIRSAIQVISSKNTQPNNIQYVCLSGLSLLHFVPLSDRQPNNFA